MELFGWYVTDLVLLVLVISNELTLDIKGLVLVRDGTMKSLESLGN